MYKICYKLFDYFLSLSLSLLRFANEDILKYIVCNKYDLNEKYIFSQLENDKEFNFNFFKELENEKLNEKEKDLIKEKVYRNDINNNSDNNNNKINIKSEIFPTNNKKEKEVSNNNMNNNILNSINLNFNSNSSNKTSISIGPLSYKVKKNLIFY